MPPDCRFGGRFRRPFSREVPIRDRFAASFRVGAISALVFLPSLVVYGVGFGMMAGAVGLTLSETTFFSAWVYAGAAQMASLQGWDYPVPLLFVALTTLAINARFILMGATLRPLMAGHHPAAVYGMLFFLVDASWAAALRQDPVKVNGVAFFLGNGLVMWGSWVATTIAGHGFGQILGDPYTLGIDFVLAAFFAVAAIAFWQKARILAPLVVAVGVAIVAERILEGPWYILVGALAGSLAGAWRATRAS